MLAGVLAMGLAMGGCVNPPGVSAISPEEVAVSAWEGRAKSERGTWYYVDDQEMVCANGSTAGMGLNVGSSQRDLVIYMSGGGACWDAARCHYGQTAANLDVDYDEGQMGRELYPLEEAGLFDRRSPVNHWKRASYAYVPYCTADMHMGRQPTTYESLRSSQVIHHRGADNFERVLERLKRWFPDAERIWMVGISAGGYGATWHFDRVATRFPEAEVHLFADAAPWLSADGERLQAWSEHWGLEVPAGCTRCRREPEYLPVYLAQRYPESRFALSVFARDPVLSAYLGILPREVQALVEEAVASQYAAPNMRSFIADGMNHETLLHLNEDVRSTKGDRLLYFWWRWIVGW